MTDTDSRLTPAHGLSQAVLDLAPAAALVRIFPESPPVTHIFGSDYFRLMVEREVEVEATRLVREHFASVADWRLAHDYHVPTGRLYRTPEPERVGFVPEDDFTFGLKPYRYVASAEDVTR